MRKVRRVSLLVGLCMIAGFGLSVGETKTSVAQDTAERPNVLVILTDDQDVESMQSMPELQRLLVDRGVTFTQAFATTPQCCPSRASFLRGQYAHNHGVTKNWFLDATFGDEGWEKFVALGREGSTVATWLHDAGYSTGYMGKYLNGYGNEGLTTHVPPGWDTWRGWQGNYGQESGRLYNINEDGVIRSYNGRDLHDTHYLAREAETFIEGHDGEPWLLWVSPNPPHVPAFVAEEHEGSFATSEMPEPASFNEADVSDKPAWIRALPFLDEAGIAEAEEDWRRRQESLQAVDDLVTRAISKLEETGQLDNTYVVFASDNGFLQYRHRVRTKGAPYEEAIRIPFVVRGPGVPEGVEREQLIANTDLAPTIADWARLRPPDFVDGRTFAPQLTSSPPTWRERLLLEFYSAHPFRGVRTSDGKTYVEYENGERELYDLATDPYQLESAHASPVHQGLIDDLRDRLTELRECSGAACRAAEGATPPEAPTNLTASASPSGVALGWDDARGAVGYNVYRSGSEAGVFERLNDEPLAASAYSDPGARPGKPSFYLVTAVDGARDESSPASASATRPDVTAPETAIVSGPAGPTNDTTPTFAFGATDDGGSGTEPLYSHSADAGAWSAWSAETSVTLGGDAGLAEGAHFFRARAKDAAGNVEQGPAERAFAVDTAGPVVRGVTPAEGARGVRPGAKIYAFFSEQVAPASVNADAVTLFRVGSSVPVAARVTYDAIAGKAILDPGPDLAAGRTYRVIVANGVRDLAGNRLDQDPDAAGNQRKVWSFTVRG